MLSVTLLRTVLGVVCVLKVYLTFLCNKRVGVTVSNSVSNSFLVITAGWLSSIFEIFKCLLRDFDDCE